MRLWFFYSHWLCCSNVKPSGGASYMERFLRPTESSRFLKASFSVPLTAISSLPRKAHISLNDLRGGAVSRIAIFSLMHGVSNRIRKIIFILKSSCITMFKLDFAHALRWVTISSYGAWFFLTVGVLVGLSYIVGRIFLYNSWPSNLGCQSLMCWWHCLREIDTRPQAGQ